MPKKKSAKSTKKSAEPTVCLVEGCSNTAYPGMEFCPIHGLVDIAVDRAKKAFDEGDILKAVLSSFGAVALESGAPMVKPAMMGAAMRFSQSGPKSQGAPRRPPPKQKVDPWKVLGLDRQKATAKDVKEVQKHFAEFYHPDRGRAVNPEVLQQVNAAVDACLKDLKGRK